MRRVLYLSAGLLATLGALLGLALGTLWIAGHSDRGRAMLERLAAHWSHGQVRIAGLAGAFPAQLTLQRLELRDANGLWLRAEQLTVGWHPSALLLGRLQIDVVAVQQLRLWRLPALAPSDDHAWIPQIRVRSAVVRQLRLGAAEDAPTLAFTAQADWHGLTDTHGVLLARDDADQRHYSADWRADGERVGATVQLREPAQGPLQRLLTLPGLGALAADLQLAGPRVAARLDFIVNAGAMHGSVRGQVDLVNPAADLQYALAAGAMAPRADLRWQNFDMHGRWQGALAQAEAEGVLTVAQLRLPGALSVGALTAQLGGHRGRLYATAQLQDLTLPGPTPALFGGDPLRIAAAIHFDETARPLAVDVSHPLLSLHLQATHDPHATRSDLTLSGRLSDLAPLGRLLGADVGGSATLEAQVHGDGARQTFTAAFSPRLTAGEARWRALLGPRSEWRATGSWDRARLTLQRLTLSGGPLSARLDGALARADGPLALRFQLQIADATVLSPALAGGVQLAGTLRGPRRALALDARLATRLSVRGAPAEALGAELHAQGLPAAPRGQLQVDGSLEGAPLTFVASVQREADAAVHWHVSRAHWKSVHAAGDGVAGNAAVGALHLRITDLADLQPLLGVTLAGSLRADLTIDPTHPQAPLRFALESPHFAAGGHNGVLHISGRGAAAHLALDADLALSSVLGLPAQVSASGVLDAVGRSLQVLDAQATLGALTLATEGPLRLFDDDGWRMEHLQLRAGKATLRAEGRLSPALDLQVDLQQLDAAILNALLPESVSAVRVDGRLSLQGSLNRPRGEFALDAKDLQFGGEAGRALPPLGLQLTGQLQEERMHVEGHLSQRQIPLLAVTGEAPLEAAGAFDLVAQGAFGLEWLNPLFQARGQQVSGALRVDAALVGTPGAPRLQGTLGLSAASFRDFRHGVHIDHMNAQIDAHDTQLQIRTFSGRAISGSLALTGTLGLLQPDLPVDLRLLARDAQPAATGLLNSHVDAELALRGFVRGPMTLAGAVHLHRTQITLPKGLPVDVAVLDVRRRGRAPPPVVTRTYPLGLDVQIDAPQEILITGRGLDAELGGQLRLTGTTAAPVTVGGFDLLRGSFTLAGSQLAFTSGRIGFEGMGLDNKINPSLDFTAQTLAAGVTTTVHVAGFVDAPRFEFSSTPSLPQDEILARLFFGESAAQMSALQVAQIAAALATLSGVGAGVSSFNPLNTLQRALRLDRLTIGTSGNAATAPSAATGNALGATIGAGRYVGKHVYVEVEQSTTGSTQVQVDVDLTQRLKLRTKLGNGYAITQGTTPENNPDGSIGLSYQFEY